MQPVPKQAASLFFYAYLRTVKQKRKYYEKRCGSRQATPLYAILFLINYNNS